MGQSGFIKVSFVKGCEFRMVTRAMHAMDIELKLAWTIEAIFGRIFPHSRDGR